MLTKITLANGQFYEFKYNVYGEITKIIYPTGGYERFAYGLIPSLQGNENTYSQANRGVTHRWVSVKGDGTDEVVPWTYQVGSPYKVITTAPDNSRTEQYLYTEPVVPPQAYGFSRDTCDSLNRLKSAEETIPGQTGWKQTYIYDRYGNRNFDAANTTTPDAQTTVPKVVNPEVLTTNNRFKQDQDNDGVADYLYDAAGNTTKDALGKQFTYDGENKQIEVKNASSVAIGKYFYDGDGKRVKKYAPSTGETTIFVYDASGKLVAEYSTTVAPATTAQVSYLTNDHLGSPRMTTDKDGKVFSRRDFMPFGEEIGGIGSRAASLGYTADEVRQKFTSYERDIESDLDFAQARYYKSQHGRFTSPDPVMLSPKLDFIHFEN